jgi:hypothetical protein
MILQTVSPSRKSLDLAIPLSYHAIYQPAILRAFLVLTTSRHGEYFLPCIICRIYGEKKDMVRVFPSVRVYSSVIVHFNDVDREQMWIWIVGGNEVVKCDPIVVDMAKWAMVSFQEHQTAVPAIAVLLQ